MIIDLARTFADRADEYKSSMLGYSVSESVDELNHAGSKELTDAWVNEQRAVGVDSAIESAKKEIASEFQYQSFDNCISACARHPQSDLSGKVEMVAWLEWFAAQLRGSQV